jgi:hypothetical protein
MTRCNLRVTGVCVIRCTHTKHGTLQEQESPLPNCYHAIVLHAQSELNTSSGVYIMLRDIQSNRLLGC